MKILLLIIFLPFVLFGCTNQTNPTWLEDEFGDIESIKLENKNDDFAIGYELTEYYWSLDDCEDKFGRGDVADGCQESVRDKLREAGLYWMEDNSEAYPDLDKMRDDCVNVRESEAFIEGCEDYIEALK